MCLDLLDFHARVLANLAASGPGKTHAWWRFSSPASSGSGASVLTRLHDIEAISLCIVLGDDHIRTKSCAPIAALIVNWQSTLTAGTQGTTLCDSRPSGIGVRLSWRRRVHLGCGPLCQSTSHRVFDHETRSGGSSTASSGSEYRCH